MIQKKLALLIEKQTKDIFERLRSLRLYFIIRYC